MCLCDGVCVCAVCVFAWCVAQLSALWRAYKLLLAAWKTARLLLAVAATKVTRAIFYKDLVRGKPSPFPHSLCPLHWLIVEQKFFALTSAARRVAFECDFDLSFAAARDKSPRPLSWKRGRSERQCGKAQVFLQLRLALAFPFPLHKCLGKKAGSGRGREQGASSSISRRLAPTCRRSLVSCLPLPLRPSFSLSLTLCCNLATCTSAFWSLWSRALNRRRQSELFE